MCNSLYIFCCRLIIITDTAGLTTKKTDADGNNYIYSTSLGKAITAAHGASL